MNDFNYEKFIKDLVSPLLRFPEDAVVKKFAEDGNKMVIQIITHADDVGRIIGKKGRIINSIRTIIYACAARDGKKVEISIDSF